MKIVTSLFVLIIILNVMFLMGVCKFHKMFIFITILLIWNWFLVFLLNLFMS